MQQQHRRRRRSHRRRGLSILAVTVAVVVAVAVGLSIAAAAAAAAAAAFGPSVSLPCHFRRSSDSSHSRRRALPTLRMGDGKGGGGGGGGGNFLSDLFRGAFANDPNFADPDDKTTGQLEGPGDGDLGDYGGGRPRNYAQLTDVQRRFLASQQNGRASSSTAAEARRGAGMARGAPVDPSALAGTSWELDLYLTGVPERDPSSDLYGQRVNISNRNRPERTSADAASEPPTVTVTIALEEGGTCVASPSPFTSVDAKPGRWKLSDDGRTLRIGIDATGYSRTVRTKGTITKVFWSESDQVTTRTSTSYTIPPGWVYGDIGVGYGLPGQLLMTSSGRSATAAAPGRGGVLRIEKKAGLLGAGTTMVQCGTFTGRMITAE